MNAKIRKSLMAGLIATVFTSPVWAADAGTQSAPTGQPQTMERGSTGATGSSGAQSGAQDTSNPLYSMTPQQLRRMDVVDATGEEIGSVQSVVRSRDQENIQLVIGAGGFLGVGGKEVAIPLNEVSLVGDKLHLSSSKAELESRPQYQQDQYVELQPADQPISDFAAFEPSSGQESQSGQSGQSGRSATGGASGMGSGSSGQTTNPGAGSGSSGSGTESPSAPGSYQR